MLLIKYATRGRPQWFRKAIMNIMNTISNPEFVVLVSIDRDDESMLTHEMFLFMQSYENIEYVIGGSDSKIEAINRDMNDIADGPSLRFRKSNFAGIRDWDILVVMSDDMFFTQLGWDNVIRQRILDHFPGGDCFLHFNDGYVKDALATMSIMDRKYYNRDGYIYHPSYKSFSCDAEAFFVAKARGRHRYFPEILATHQHPANAKIPTDDTYHRNSLHTPADTKNYWERLHNDFGMKEEGIPGPYPWDQYKKR